MRFPGVSIAEDLQANTIYPLVIQCAAISLVINNISY